MLTNDNINKLTILVLLNNNQYNELLNIVDHTF